MAGTATVIESCHLEYRDGTSDKEYHIYLCDHGGVFTVHAEYGRRGKVSQRSEKGTFKSRFSAKTEFAKFEGQKRGKGYDSMGTTRAPTSIPMGARPTPKAPPPAPVFDAALLAFNVKLAEYVTVMSPDELTAGRTATARLATDVGVSASKSLSALPSHLPMVALLGAISFASQDYTDDAVLLGSKIMSAKTSNPATVEATMLLPSELKGVLEAVLDEHPNRAGIPGLVHHLFHKAKQSWFL